jgi:hypothetical protein
MDDLDEQQIELLLKTAHDVNPSVINRINQGLACHPSNIGERRDMIIDCDIELRLKYARRILEKVGLLPAVKK